MNRFGPQAPQNSRNHCHIDPGRPLNPRTRPRPPRKPEKIPQGPIARQSGPQPPDYTVVSPLRGLANPNHSCKTGSAPEFTGKRPKPGYKRRQS